MTNENQKESPTQLNQLGVAPVGALLRKFAIPSIIAMIVGALYNIVDQLFIGNSIGELGNAATNIVFPLTTVCTAIALLLGIGGASAFNLSMGEGKKDKALFYIGNSVSLLVIFGLVLMAVTLIFLNPILIVLGSPYDILPLAKEYLQITAIGFPFLILSTGGTHLVRADGSPNFSMFCNIVGAVINIILDYVFIFICDMGMAGAALATIIGQAVSAVIILVYMSKFKTGKLTKSHYKPNFKYIKYLASLGMAQFFNQLAMMVVQVIMNNSLKYYGSLSIYGESIPLACSGIINKVGFIFFAICIGIAQGMQPITSYNYGAKHYDRVKKAINYAMITGSLICVVAFAIFQIFPRQIIELFGNGSELYFSFSERYFRVYLFFTFINNIQPMSSTFFSSIGKPAKGTFLSLTRQIIFLLPLLIVLPIFMGIDGIMYAGPVADLLAAVISAFFLVKELIKISKV